MAALTASDVTVTLSHRDRDVVPPPAGRKMFQLPTITVGDGVKTYPAGGIPMPDKSQFGFKRELQFVSIEQPPGNGFFYKYDRANNKLKIFTQGAVTGSTAATTCGNGALAEDSSGGEGSVRLSGTAADTTYDMGGLIELPTTIAPTEVSLALLMVGE